MSFNISIGENIIELDSTNSTNNYLSKLINETDIPNGTVILAHNQTKGRGQRGSTWLTENNKNISCSYYIQFNKLTIQNVFLISMAVANAIHKCICKHIIGCKIKWPNDILIENRKICGVLIENTIAGKSISQSIIGIGINVNQIDFPKHINATSFALELNEGLDKKTVFNELSDLLKEEINLLNNGFINPIKNYYLNNLIGYKSEKKYRDLTNNNPINGQILTVENNGLLVIQANSSTIKYNFKEIEFIL
jgi:BirA family biotin operon repressor/biotin-[acetyl-CoA-carboxylase] ligase